MTHQTRSTHALVSITLATLCFGSAGCLEEPAAASNKNRQQILGIQCEAQLTISGTFTPGMAQPVDVFGCWPVGTWTFTATVGSSDCSSTPQLEPQYSVVVTHDAVTELQSYAYATDPANQRVLLGVSSGGAGLCEGGFSIFSADGKSVVTLKPTLHADGTITGTGEYELYDHDAW